MTPLSNNENENQIENGNADDKQPLKNGIRDKTQIMETMTDHTDDAVPRQDENPLSSIFSTKNKTKRKYKMYDNGKRNRISLSPLTTSGLRFEKTIKNKTGLTRIGLVLTILCMLLTIALVLCIILWPSTAHSKQYPICIKPSCLRSSAEKVHELLVTTTVSTISTKTSLSWKLKNFYDSCMNIDNVNAEEERPLKKIIDSLGGWQVLKDFSASQWDSYKTLTALHSHYHISPFFQISVVPDIVNNKQNVIQLKPPLLGLPSASYYHQSETSPMIRSYMHFIKDIVQLFGATMVDATQFSQDLFFYEKRITEILDRSEENVTSSYKRLTIKELNQILFPIPFYEILMGTLPNANLNNENHVLVSNIQYFRRLPTLVSTSDSISLNKYLIWRLVDNYVPYLSKKYVDTLQIFRREFLDQNEPIPRWEFCISTLQKFVGFGLMAMFENQVEDMESIIFVVSQMFTETLSVIKKDFWAMKHTETQERILEKLNSIGIQIGFSPDMLKKEYIDDYYANFNAIKNDFFQNIIYGVSFIQEDLQRRLKSSQEEYRWINDMTSQPVFVSYSPAVNKVIVPSPLLQPPYFEKDYPFSSLYGGLGREIASAFISSLILNKSYENQTQSDRKDYMTVISECALHRNFVQLNVTDTRLLVITLAGLKYAYQTLNSELSEVEHSHQPAMETFENDELFFIFYVQSICTMKTEKRLQNEISFPNTLSDIILQKREKLKESY
ncbi:hypothetical protein PGB90_008723 [Kerria lacca]